MLPVCHSSISQPFRLGGPAEMMAAVGEERGWFHVHACATFTNARPPFLWPNFKWAVARQRAMDQELGTPALEFLFAYMRSEDHIICFRHFSAISNTSNKNNSKHVSLIKRKIFIELLGWKVPWRSVSPVIAQSRNSHTIQILNDCLVFSWKCPVMEHS